MDAVFEAIAEAIRGLQAGQIAHGRMLRAVISTHPDPDALRRAWRAYSSASIADAEVSKISDPARRAVHALLSQALTDWSGYLEHDLPRGESRQD